jgi:hypothetical protein
VRSLVGKRDQLFLPKAKIGGLVFGLVVSLPQFLYYYIISHIFHEVLFRAVGMDSEDFKSGMTKVFFRPGKECLSTRTTICHYTLYVMARPRIEPGSPSLKGKRGDHDTTSTENFYNNTF